MLVRHTAAAVAAGVCYGRLDLEVRSEAEVAAVAAALALDGFGRVVTSPARRCRVLAEAVAIRCGSVAVEDVRLLELDFGAWEGRAWDDLDRAEFDAWAAGPLVVAPPKGETGTALLRRVRAACEDILRAGVDCVVVAHGGPLKLMRAIMDGGTPDLLGAPPALGSACVVLAGGHATVSAVRTAHSTDTAQAPRTSPV
jgi:alpha-ribazole phosphatase